MDTTARADTASVRNAISAYNPATIYEVEGNTLYVTAPGGLTPEQRELIREHKPELLALLTTPPEATGTCIRGHVIEWRCNHYGVWLCACYFETPEPVVQPEQKSVPRAKEGNTAMLPSLKNAPKVQSPNPPKYSIQELALW